MLVLIGVGVHQLPNFPECVAIGVHPLLDLGGMPSNVLQFFVYPRVVLPVEAHPLHSGVQALTTSSVEPSERRSSCTCIKIIWHTSGVG